MGLLLVGLAVLAGGGVMLAMRLAPPKVSRVAPVTAPAPAPSTLRPVLRAEEPAQTLGPDSHDVAEARRWAREWRLTRGDADRVLRLAGSYAVTATRVSSLGIRAARICIVDLGLAPELPEGPLAARALSFVERTSSSAGQGGEGALWSAFSRYVESSCREGGDEALRAAASHVGADE